MITPRLRRSALTTLLLAVLASCDSGGSRVAGDNAVSIASFTSACIESESGTIVCPATDMAKISRTGSIPFEHADYDWSDGPLKLHAARNETIGFQVILRTAEAQAGSSPAQQVKIDFAAPTTASGSVLQEGAAFTQTSYLAYYHPIDNAGYTWGPPTNVLPWPASYPDALVPQFNSCSSVNRANFSAFELPRQAGQNQSVWLDTFVHPTTNAGTYSQDLLLEIDGIVTALPLQITVHDTTLPDKPNIDAVAEIYRSYIQEGAGFDSSSEQWSTMSRCYQQLAHQHRMVFIERIPDLLANEKLTAYADAIDPALTGALFTDAYGYQGPGVNTPVNIWRTPWPQQFDGTLTSPIDQREVDRYEGLADIWMSMAADRGWTNTQFFAYVFDEVDGPRNVGDGSLELRDYIALVHEQMARVQTSIDNGSGSTGIDLLWTSHSNPSIWADDPELDLTGKIRLWAPNATAADTDFLGERIQQGDTAWFYHSGHPAIGAHSINASGIELRTWGVTGARYGFQGQFMWAANLGSDERPYREPQYRPDDDRAGNGVLVYPGNQLDKIGYARSPGPVPSMRLKAWRRGLQDAELFFLAEQQSPAAAKNLINAQIPRALTEGSGPPSWSSHPADWIDFHRQLLEMASGG